MTPLTHAAVGAAVYRKLGRNRLALPLALLLIFLSHFALDAIPHFEEFGPLLRYRETRWVFVGLGATGLLCSLLIWHWNRNAGKLWLALALWMAVGGYGPTLWRGLSALLILALVALLPKTRAQFGCLLAAMVSMSPDFLPLGWRTMRALHDSIHYHTDWGTYLYTRFVGQPVPAFWHQRVASPYFVAGWALELIVEGCVFFTASWVLIRSSEPAAEAFGPELETVSSSTFASTSASPPPNLA